MFHVILIEPEIPPNAGNVIRLCANTGAELHLIHPLGFAMEDSRLRRAGLDYREWARVREHADIAAFLGAVRPERIFAFTSKAQTGYHQVDYQPGDCFVFGPETRGLTAGMLEQLAPAQQLRIPMVPGSRSLNLSNAVSVVVYEAWRQQGFAGGG
ncbi:MAG TPA: tRNA (cytidine(34)-2'-O)-methyltransferase [Gammaproteobacteria bacterium]|nr:tRNA (cytidine(34)-2'-O)-methyltransferase [Gammaproteobacteria bacterium]